MGRFNFISNKYFKIITASAIFAIIFVTGILAIFSYSLSLKANVALSKVTFSQSLNSAKPIKENNKSTVKKVLLKKDNMNLNSVKAQPKTVNNTCRAQIVMEQNSKMVLHSQNANVRMEMASTTKLVTALITLENLPLDKQITIPKEAVGIEGSSIYLREGQVFSVQDLLHGLMLRSGNDSAVALAIATSGNLPSFIQLMNKKALQLGLKNTHFENPHGLSNANHYTTAYELGVLACEAMSNENFCKIVATKNYIVQKNDTHERMIFINKNKMLGSFDGANGIKTGYTTRSGRCLVSAAKRDGMQLVCVTLNDYDMWEDSKMLMQSVFNNYIAVNLGDKKDCKWTIPLGESGLENGQCENIEICLKRSIVFPMKKNQKIDLTFKIQLDKNLAPIVNSGQKIGNIFIYNDNCLLFEEEIITMKEINKLGDLRKLSNFVGDLSLEDYNGEIKQIFGCKRSGIA